jgi:hypothetical protein
MNSMISSKTNVIKGQVGKTTNGKKAGLAGRFPNLHEKR